MKLKLEQLHYCSVLSVSESIEPEQVAVIKAGLAQIAQAATSGNPPAPVLIDLCALPDALLRSERLVSECLALKAWSACQGREVFVASPVPNLGDVASRELGLTLLQSASTREAAVLASCLLYAEKLERQKHSYEKKLSSLDSGVSPLRKLRKENSDLRKRITFTESQIRSQVAMKNPAGSFEENSARLRTAEKTLTNVLEKHGFLEASSS